LAQLMTLWLVQSLLALVLVQALALVRVLVLE
jgi:hypothetical protein